MPKSLHECSAKVQCSSIPAVNRRDIDSNAILLSYVAQEISQLLRRRNNLTAELL